jgi:hypothetical protein
MKRLGKWFKKSSVITLNPVIAFWKAPCQSGYPEPGRLAQKLA